MKNLRQSFIRLRTGILLVLLLLAAGAFCWHEWLSYILHLARHQSRVMWSRTAINKLLNQSQLSSEKISKLQLIVELRQYARELYALKESHTFETYVDLQRPEIGWNLTATPEFSFEPVQFKFPFIGSFSYLGFFERARAEAKAEKLKATGHDTYLSEIGGYSTIGWFNDPVFNTYLDLPEVSLVRLVLHEISHEKLYFKDDSTFSESLSTFIEREAARRFYFDRRKYVLPEKNRQAALAEYERFWQVINETRDQLNQLYASDKTTIEKRAEKKRLYENLHQRLKDSLKSYRYITAPAALASYPELNNAILIQYRRYTPQKNGFARLLQNCNNDIPCWFDELRKLQHCPAGRKLFLSDDIPLAEALRTC